MAASMITTQEIESCSSPPVCGNKTVTGTGTGVAAAPVEGSAPLVSSTGVGLAGGSAMVGVSVAEA
jgi:hypothetical protein